MKSIEFQISKGVYSLDQENTARVFSSLPMLLWVVECREIDGIAQTLIDECLSHSRHWTGWTFLTPGQDEIYDQVDGSQHVPVLLFEDQEDAFWAEIRLGSGQGLNIV